MNDSVNVIGAGQCGTLMAIMLARHGFRVDVYERFKDPRVQDAEAGRSINLALAETGEVIAVIETTAGQGTNLGYRFEHLAEIIDQVGDHSRVGVYLDTCHTRPTDVSWEGCETVREPEGGICDICYDRWGNVVSATPSCNVFGDKGDGGATGVTHGNRLRSLNSTRGHPNRIQPGKRPRITLTPTLVLKDGRPILAISVAGGDLQDQAALKKFAYQQKEHARAVQLTRELDWYEEEMFARFKVINSFGSWDGVNLEDLRLQGAEE